MRQRNSNDPTGSDEEHVGILEFSTEQATENVNIEEREVPPTRKNSSASVSGTHSFCCYIDDYTHLQMHKVNYLDYKTMPTKLILKKKLYP